MPWAERTRTSVSGLSAFELVVTMALAALLGSATIGSASRLAGRTELEAARLVLVLHLIEARRLAYLSAQTVGLRKKGPAELELEGPLDQRRSFELPPAVTLSRWPLRPSVRFFGSGLADNATLGLSSARGGEVLIVINQRGLVR